MKKYILIVAILLMNLNLFSIDKLTYSKWNISGEVGLNKFDGDINQNMKTIFPTSIWGGTYGIGIEYKMTDTWGINSIGYYVPVNAKTKLNGNLKSIKTDIWTGSVGLTLDFTHLIFPYSSSRFTVNGSVGIGYSFYSYNLNPSLTKEDINFIKSPSPGISPQFPVTEKYGLSTTLPVSLSLKYNYSKFLDLGIKSTYICFNKDNLEGIWTYKGVTDDRVGLITFFVNYKALPRTYPKKDRSLQLNIDKLEKKIKEQDVKIKEQRNKFDSLSSYILNKKENTILLHKDSVTIEEEIPSIYFDFDKYNLDDWSTITLSKIARKMIKDKSIDIMIIGYCDWIGDVPYNFNLSYKRVYRAKKELVDIWKIDEKRIIVNGKGRVDDPKIKYRPNRRCDFIFIK